MASTIFTKKQYLRHTLFSSSKLNIIKELTMNALNNENILSANKAAIDTLLSVANTALATAESLAALNLGTAREALNDGVKNAKAVMSIKSPQEAASLNATLGKPAVEKAVAYSRSVYEISTGAANEMGKLIQSQFAELNKAAQELAEKTAKASPFGSDVALAAVRQAVTAANSAFDNLNKAAKQAAEFTEAGVSAATSAAKKAAGATKSTSRAKK
jgi:phasin family protein